MSHDWAKIYFFRRPTMKLINTLIALTFALTSIISKAEINASNQCDGIRVIVRVSDIVSGGSVEGVKKAAQMHEAWYRANGVMNNRQVVGELYKNDGKTMIADTSKVISLHVNPPKANEGTAQKNWGDAGFKEFVSEYNKNNKVTNEYMACLPKGVFAGY